MGAAGEKLVDLLISIWAWLLPFVVVDHYERAVLLRIGNFNQVLEPGFHWIFPFGIDKCIGDNVVTRTHKLQEQSLTTKDGKSVTVRGVVTAKINDIYKAALSVEHVDDAMADSCLGEIGRAVINSSWEEMSKPEFVDALSKACRKNAWRYGIEIERVQLSDIVLAPAYRVFGVDIKAAPT